MMANIVNKPPWNGSKVNMEIGAARRKKVPWDKANLNFCQNSIPYIEGGS